MSEKRFRECKGSNGLFSIFDNEDAEDEPLLFNSIGNVKNVVALLNSLSEENEQLRQSIDHMIETATEISNRNVLLHEEIGRQTRKNKELQQKIDYLCEKYEYKGEQ